MKLIHKKPVFDVVTDDDPPAGWVMAASLPDDFSETLTILIKHTQNTSAGKLEVTVNGKKPEIDGIEDVKENCVKKLAICMAACLTAWGFPIPSDLVAKTTRSFGESAVHGSSFEYFTPTPSY